MCLFLGMFLYLKIFYIYMERFIGKKKKKKKLIIDEKSDIVVHEDYVEEEDIVEID